MPAQRPLLVCTVQEEDSGWCSITAEARVIAVDADTRRGMGRYGRLIVPGSGLLRLQWLAAIKRRAEIPTQSAP
jgi:hypothetical protein